MKMFTPSAAGRPIWSMLIFLMMPGHGATSRAVASEAPEFHTPARDRDGLTASAERDEALPNVLVIGDSISIGYMKTVVAALHGKANVARPKTNCGNTANGVARLDEWLGSSKWDVIHFNFGLHDLCYRSPESRLVGNRDKVNGRRDVSPGDYRKNLGTILVRLEATGAKLIFATTTVVPPGEAGRFEGDEIIYNRIAAEVMRQHGVAIDDLFGLTKGFGSELFAGRGNVHYTAAGYKLLGAWVAESIERLLPVRDGSGASAAD